MNLIKLLTLPVLAIVVITLLELFALSRGIDGIALTVSCSLISSVATGGVMRLKASLKNKDLEINFNGNRNNNNTQAT